MRRTLLVFIAMGLGACATPRSPESILAGPPPTLESIKAEIDDQICRSPGQISHVQPANREVVGRKGGCAAHMPLIFNAAGIVAGCTSMFDVSDYGRVMNAETRCTVGAGPTPLPSDWAELAKVAYTYSIDRQLETMSYPSASEALGLRRTDLVSVAVFTAPGHRFLAQPPPEFQRTSRPRETPPSETSPYTPGLASPAQG